MTQLELLDEVGQRAVVRHVARCRACKRKLSDPESLGFVIGPTCRKRLGIGTRARIRLAAVRPGGDCEGQTDLLEDPNG